MTSSVVAEIDSCQHNQQEEGAGSRERIFLPKADFGVFPFDKFKKKADTFLIGTLLVPAKKKR